MTTAPKTASAPKAQCCTCTRPVRGQKAPGATPELARAFKALGDETRLGMMLLIAGRDELCVCEIEPHFDLSQPTVSHHLKQLKDAGLVSAERRGTWVYYRAERAILHKLRQLPFLRQ